MSTRPGRLIRAAVGLALIAVSTALGGNWWILAVAGLLPLATGVFGICPISPFFGRSWRGIACRAGSSSARRLRDRREPVALEVPVECVACSIELSLTCRLRLWHRARFDGPMGRPRVPLIHTKAGAEASERG
jgi:hypothetical protein